MIVVGEPQQALAGIRSCLNGRYRLDIVIEEFCMVIHLGGKKFKNYHLELVPKMTRHACIHTHTKLKFNSRRICVQTNQHTSARFRFGACLIRNISLKLHQQPKKGLSTARACALKKFNRKRQR